jgi:hypothetical protein
MYTMSNPVRVVIGLNNPYRVEEYIYTSNTQGSSQSLATLGFGKNAVGVQDNENTFSAIQKPQYTINNPLLTIHFFFPAPKFFQIVTGLLFVGELKFPITRSAKRGFFASLP